MDRIIRKTILPLLMLSFCLYPVFADKRGRIDYTELYADRPQAGTIRIQGEVWYETYKFRITPEMLGVTICLDGADADLDLYAKFGSPMEEYSEADRYSETDLYNETLKLFRYDDVGLQDGYVYVDVAYMLDSPPMADQKALKDISYTITLSVVKAAAERELKEDQPVVSELHPESFMVKTFPIKIPRRSESLRVDLYGTTGDLDLMVTDSPIIPSDAQPLALAETVAGNETLVMDLGRKYWGETLYVSVFDSIASDRVQKFSLVSRFSKDPPDFLLDLPVWGEYVSPRENALYATVELIAEDGGGSGTILSEDGVILTNYHVLTRSKGGISQEVVVAIVENLYVPAVERFKARVLEYSEQYDCALLKITSGYYGQPLPDNYRFPYHRIGSDEELVLGDDIRIIGYPTIGGSGSRPTLNLSKGILSGGEIVEDTYVLKTDALISSGNSGGAAVDGQYRLLGIPSFLIEEDTESVGYIIPLSSVPQEWFRRYLP